MTNTPRTNNENNTNHATPEIDFVSPGDEVVDSMTIAPIPAEELAELKDVELSMLDDGVREAIEMVKPRAVEATLFHDALGPYVKKLYAEHTRLFDGQDNNYLVAYILYQHYGDTRSALQYLYHTAYAERERSIDYAKDILTSWGATQDLDAMIPPADQPPYVSYAGYAVDSTIDAADVPPGMSFRVRGDGTFDIVLTPPATDAPPATDTAEYDIRAWARIRRNERMARRADLFFERTTDDGEIPIKVSFNHDGLSISFASAEEYRAWLREQIDTARKENAMPTPTPTPAPAPLPDSPDHVETGVLWYTI